ncbi:MAG: SUMF1/EgtB/PvdO family nonheme iron enzyme, partial [Chloroflexota bacterium]
MTDERAKRLANLRQAYESGALDEDTYHAAVAALATLASLETQNEGGINLGEASSVTVGQGDLTGRDKMTAENNSNIVSGSVDGDVLINSTKIVYTGEDPAAAQALLRRYLQWVVDDCAPLKLKAIDQGAARPGQQPLGLANVYVDLNVDFRVPPNYKSLSSFLKDVQRRQVRAERPEERESRLASVVEALAYHPQFVLLGAPGSGKSTFSAYVALSLAQAGLGNDNALKRLSAEWRYGPLLPVRVILRQFAASLPADLKQGRAAHLWRFISEELANCGLPEKTGSLLQDVAMKSGALFLLDGLDEAGDESRRARVLEAVTEFTRAAGDKCRFLLTARPYAWEDAEARIVGMPAVYRLADFDPEQIATFITRWYEAISAIGWVNIAEAAEKIVSLQTAASRDDLQPLARNPLLLTLMATLHSNRGRLPDDRADLYNEVVELLLQRWNETSGADRSLLDALQIPTLKLANLREVIEQLAFEAHTAHIGKEGTADISETDLLDAFRPLLGNSRDKAAFVVEYVEKRAGLLVGQGPRDKVRQFTFPHRTFQEYLAACYLAGRDNFSERAFDLAYASPAHWRETLTLAARRAGPGRGVPAADALIHTQSIEDYRRKGNSPNENDWRAATLAGEQLLEIGLAVIDSREQYRTVRERVAGWLAALIEANALPTHERVRTGDLLGRLGDPRDLEELIAIPAGPFWMGSKEEGTILDERPQHQVTFPVYRIGKYPVTVGQWKKFLAANPGHQYDPDSLKGFDNQPAHDVSWHDACTYCDWLTAVWRKANKISA